MKRILFLHGVGSSGGAMRPLAEQLAPLPEAFFPDGPAPFDAGQGRQWFSLTGISEANRPERIAAALPDFCQIVARFGDPRESLLVGFSQGAIMALHAVATGLPAAGVVALSGRLAGPVPLRPDWPPVTLVHGSADPVMPPTIVRATETWLRAAGAEPRLHLFEGLGHGIDARGIAVLRSLCAE